MRSTWLKHHRLCLYYLTGGLFLLTCRPPGHATKRVAAYYSNINEALMAKSDLDDSARYFFTVDSALDHSNWGNYFRYYQYRNFFAHKKNFTKALNYADSALQAIANEQRDPDYARFHTQMLLYKGECLVELHQPTEAFAVYYEARQNILKTNDSCSFYRYSNRLGYAAYLQKKYRDAIVYYEQSFKEGTHCHDSSIDRLQIYQQGTIDNIALCYSRLHNNDSALLLFDSTLRYIEQYKSGASPAFIESARAVVYGNKAKTLLDKGDTATAEQLLKEGIRINSLPHHESRDVPYSQAKLVTLYLASNRLEEAGKLLPKLKTSLDTLPNLEMQLRWYELQIDYLEKTDRSPAAHQYLKQYLPLKDSMNAEQQKIYTTDLGKEFSYLRNQHDISTLQKLNQLKTMYLLIAATGIILTLAIIGLILRYAMQSRKHVLILRALHDDIDTKNKHMQKILHTLEQSQDDNNRMLRVIAHDLRNPVGGMTSLAELLLMEDEEAYTDQQRQMLELILTSGKHSLSLIQDILQFNVSPANMEITHIELAMLLKYCIDMLHTKAVEKRQQISLHSQEALSVNGDREKLWRVFGNLISNAIKFSPINGRIHVSVSTTGGEAIVSVADNGIGIPSAMREKLFRPLADIKRKGTAGEESFGLGLTICKQIVEAHGGRIWLGEETEGAVFYVALPLP